MCVLLERISCMIVAGGLWMGPKPKVEVLTEDFEIKQLSNLPRPIYNSSMVLHNGTILLCGGWNNEQTCLHFDHGTWTKHSSFNKKRYKHSTVATPIATFVFGGLGSGTTYEYLPKDSTTWLMGKTEIPGNFWYGCAIAVKSEQEIWLIGGFGTEKRILSFNVNNHAFQVLTSQLNLGRYEHQSAFIPNTNKVMITGGVSYSNGLIIPTEILDTEDGSVTIASPLNSKRSSHGMGVITINGEDKLAVLGGYKGKIHDSSYSVELYNTQKEAWETTGINLNQTNYRFGFLTIKLSDIISKL